MPGVHTSGRTGEDTCGVTGEDTCGVTANITMAEDDDDDCGPPLALRWTDHKQVLTRVMSVLRHKELFADVTLICGEKHYAVHKFVLCTCSSYLEKLLDCAPGDHPVLVLTETPIEAVEAMLDFLYLGQADLRTDNLDQLLDLAHEFRIRGLISSKDYPDRQKCREDAAKLDVAVDMPDNTIKSRKSKDSAAQKHSVHKPDDDPDDTSETKSNPKKNRDQDAKASDIVKTMEEINENTSCRVFQCKYCKQLCDTSIVLERHELSHLEKQFLPCPECPFRTLDKVDLNKHISKHVKAKLFSCPYCPAHHCLEKQHVTHQRRTHPNMKVVINTSSVPTLKSHNKVQKGKSVQECSAASPPFSKKMCKSLRSDSLLLPARESNISNRGGPSLSPTAKVLNSPKSSASSSPSPKVHELTKLSASPPPELPSRAKSVSSLSPPAKIRRISRNSTSPVLPSRKQKRRRSSSSSSVKARSGTAIMSSPTLEVPSDNRCSSSSSQSSGVGIRLSMSPSSLQDFSRSSSSSSSIRSPGGSPSNSPPSKYRRKTRSSTKAESLRRQSREK